MRDWLRVERLKPDSDPRSPRQGLSRALPLKSRALTVDHGAMTAAPTYLQGRLLVAMPGIEDPRFERAVVFICAHDGDHAMGLTLNRPIEGMTVSKLLTRLKIKTPVKPLEDLVLMGGPVEPERGFVLHTDDYVGEPAERARARGRHPDRHAGDP